MRNFFLKSNSCFQDSQNYVVRPCLEKQTMKLTLENVKIKIVIKTFHGYNYES